MVMKLVCDVHWDVWLEFPDPFDQFSPVTAQKDVRNVPERPGTDSHKRVNVTIKTSEGREARGEPGGLDTFVEEATGVREVLRIQISTIRSRRSL